MNEKQTIIVSIFWGLIFVVIILFLLRLESLRTNEKPTIDLNQDGRVDIVDWSIFDSRFAQEKTE